MHHAVHKVLIYRVAVQLHGQDDVFIHIQDRHQIVVLKDKADIAAAEDRQFFIVLLCQFVAPDDYAAGGGRIKSAHHVKQRGFAAAGGSHHGHKFALLHGKVHTVQSAGNVGFNAIILFKVNCL